MPYTKLQSGDWLAAGTCTEPEYRLVGKDQTPRCRCGILVARSDELDEQGRHKPTFMNIVAWRGMAEVLRRARKGDLVLAIGRLQVRKSEGRTFKDVYAAYVNVVHLERYNAFHEPASAEPPDLSDLSEEDDGELPF